MTSVRPLDGIRVIDFSRVLAGPLIGQMLGDLGADVIKIERPGHGDDTRTWGPPWKNYATDGEADDLEATYYMSLNRNKRSIVLDLKDEGDVAFARRLALTGDIVLDNFKPGVMAKLGLDRASLAMDKPDIITATVTAFGADSAASELPGYDLAVQGMSGIMHLTGEVEGRPLRVGVPIVDMLTGYNATVGVLAALHERGQTGVGRHVEVSLMDAGLAGLLNHQTGVLMGGQNPARGGNRHYSIAPYESYRCADGDIIVAAANDKLFAGVCRVIDRTDLIDDPRFDHNTIRRQNLEALNEILEPAFAAGTREHWIARLRAEDVPCGPINSLREALEWADAMGMEPIFTGGDDYQAVRNPIRIDGEVITAGRRPPRLGEHTDEIRSEIETWDGES
ncbi:MAG: CoA transferase [Actinomycetota bacterium]